MGGRGSKSSRGAAAAEATQQNFDVSQNRMDADAAKASANVALENRKAANEADVNDKPKEARVAARAAAAAAKNAETMAGAAEARARIEAPHQTPAQQAAMTAHATAARQSAEQAKLDAWAAKRSADSAGRRATGNYRR